MKSNFLYFFNLLIINFFLISATLSAEIFNFDVTEVKILEEGNKFIGKKEGIATSEDGTTIKANEFEYDKSKNILIAVGNVYVHNKKDKIKIFSQKVTYYKNKELIITEGQSKATDDEIIIEAHKFNFNKITNILSANGDVKIDDTIENYKIFADNITFLRNKNIFFTKGKTNAIVQSKYNFISSDVTLDRNSKQLISNKKSKIEDDNSNLYRLSSFLYFYEKKLLKGKNVEIDTNNLKEKNDKFYFSSAFIDFQNNSFISKDTNILLHKKLFDKERYDQENKNNNFLGQNDPRILGVSSKGNEDSVIIDKAIFTSCKKNDNCPPWSIKANKIIHDRSKQNISYENAILNLYDIPVFYFPKFFHPDPSVDRRSGLLQPRLNNSDILGTSFSQPYFHVISPNKDITFKPTIFDNRIYMLQNEYRQENKQSSFIADFNYIRGYQSSINNNEYSNRNSISHFFAKFNRDLGLKKFLNSKLDIFVSKVNNDTYLKIFENVLSSDKKFENDFKNQNSLASGLELSLDHKDYSFTAGMNSYENLQKLKNDRYQYVFPYYNFSTTLFSNVKGSLAFSSDGRNTLSNTNNLNSKLTNNLNYTTNNFYSKYGFENNFGIYFKNLNATGKNDVKYKSNLQSELLNIYELSTSLPLIKTNENNFNYITPKLSFRINPSDMKNHKSENRLITTDNIFDINRLGLSDSYEAGKSITLGLDFKKEDKIDIEKYIEIKFATILRDKEENKIPTSSTVNRKTSNLFGSAESSFSENFSLNYDFSIDNDFNEFEHNSIEAELSVNNFVTKFNFIEKNGEMGDTNTIENTTEYSFDQNNSIIFKTRRNRKISLTEYYDLVYEYQNDCLTAGIKYRKTYYEDRDLRPKEDLFFTITLFPLTTLDQKIEESAWRGENAIQNIFN